MPTAIDSTPTSVTLNSFASVAEADAYFDKRLHDSVWTAATTATKEAALMWSSNQLNTLAWRGVRTSGTQPMAWPRTGMSYTEYDNENEANYTVVTIAVDAIPQVLKDATAELALSLMTSDSTIPSSAMPAGITDLKVDTIALKFSKTKKYGFMSDNLKNMLAALLTASAAYNAPVVRV